MFTRNRPGTSVQATGTALSTSRAVGLITMLALMASRLAAAQTASHRQWWADAGIGCGAASVGTGGVTGRYNSGDGGAGMAGVGYDWKMGQGYTHV